MRKAAHNLSLFEPMADASGGGESPLLTLSTSSDPAALENRASIQIYSGIGGWGFDEHDLASALARVDQSVDVLEMRFHSRGGSAFTGFFIGDAVRRHARKIGARLETVNDGLALSIASYLMMLGEKRTMARNGWLMIHSAWSEVRGNAAVLLHTASLLQKLDPKILAAYAQHTTLKSTELQAAMEINAGAGTWYSAEEALDLGFVTDIEDLDAPDVPDEEQDLSGYKNAPDAALAQYGKRADETEALAEECLAFLRENPEIPPTATPAGEPSAAEVLALIEKL